MADRRCIVCNVPVAPKRQRCDLCRLQHEAEVRARRLRTVHQVVVRFPSGGEHALIARAAKTRGMRVQEYCRQVLHVASTETITSTKFELDPHERRDPLAFPIPFRVGGAADAARARRVPSVTPSASAILTDR